MTENQIAALVVDAALKIHQTLGPGLLRMEYKEWLITCGSDSISLPHPKAQRRKVKTTGCQRSSFAPLHLCARNLSLILAILVLSIASSAQQRQQIRPSDTLRVSNVTDAQISPNGQWVVYSVSSVNEDQTVNTLWLARIALEPFPIPTPTPQRRPAPYADWHDIRSTPRLLLPSGWSASMPRWSPDSSSIAFLSRREEQDGLWVVKLDKPEPRFLTPITSTNFFITYTGEPFSWSPDSRRIAYVSAKAETQETPSLSRRANDPRVIDRIQYKSRTSFSDNRRTHVWVIDVERPMPQQLTTGLFYDHAVSFSPRGDEILFLSNREPDPDANNNSDIFAVDLSGQTRQITDTKGCEYDPVWSPDGRSIAYTATQRVNRSSESESVCPLLVSWSAR